MILICDKCGEEFKSGIANVLEHQFERCKGHTKEKVKTNFGNFSIKAMPYIKPSLKIKANEPTRH